MALTKANNRMIDGAALALVDYGAVGDGTTDDTVAIQAAIDAASTGQLILGSANANYRITATLNFNDTRFNGQYCTITKDFDGVGIDITGGSVYTRLYNFTITASAGQTATDYDAAAASHGIKVNATRVEAYDVTVTNHKGAGWWLETTTGGNMNKSKYIRIVGNGNSRAGCYMSGTDDNMSVWEFNGRFQSNKGYGIYSTSDCSARDFDMWIYAEANHAGASFPAGAYAVEFNKLRNARIWAYVEQQAGPALELKAGTNCENLVILSTRQNTDLIEGTNCAYLQGKKFLDKDTARAGTPIEVVGQLSRIANDGEYVQAALRGSGGYFGYLKGEGNSSGNQWIGLLDSTEAVQLRLNDSQLETNADGFFRMHNAQNGIREIALARTTPTSNQVTLTVTFADTTAQYGTGLLEVFLCADIGGTAIDATYLSHYPVAVRAGASTMTVYSEVQVHVSNITKNASYPTTSGVTMTIVFDCAAGVTEVMGHVTMRGGEAYITSASLS